MKTVTLVSSYDICAAHKLWRSDWNLEKNQQVFGKCAQTHGHQYTLELLFEGQINPDTGMLINEFDVQKIVSPFLEAQFDHKYLNDDVDFFKTHLPTAEWISVWVFDQLKGSFPQGVKLKEVVVRETPNLAVKYSGEK